ncbi:hypothetical protein ACIGBL_34840 [Streptomyces sp. NPDC085614]|uniref:hypothetical protein n=1 Tax=Streptomyces sp. NPDC085614 TaxID=3365733 RepID=UPI0037CFFDB0
MAVVVRLIGVAEAVVWRDEVSDGETLRFFYELRESGALLVHVRSRAVDEDGHVRERQRVEVVYGPAAWAEVRGDH